MTITDTAADYDPAGLLPKGIINVPLSCGHTAQMKRVIASMRKLAGEPSYCHQCAEPKLAA
jgi:hypothetical protein